MCESLLSCFVQQVDNKSTTNRQQIDNKATANEQQMSNKPAAQQVLTTNRQQIHNKRAQRQQINNTPATQIYIKQATNLQQACRKTTKK